VREDDDVDAVDAQAGLREVLVERAGELREAGVDRAQARIVLEEIPVHLFGAEAMDARRDLGGLADHET
jgi:hypothetical protein